MQKSLHIWIEMQNGLQYAARFAGKFSHGIIVDGGGSVVNAGAGGKGDHEVLNGEDQRNGGESILTDAGDEDAIDDIIKGLDEHGDDERQGHIKNELFDRHCPHFVFFWHGIDGHDDLRKSIFAQIADLTYSILLLNENVNEREKGSLLTFVWIG